MCARYIFRVKVVFIAYLIDFKLVYRIVVQQFVVQQFVVQQFVVKKDDYYSTALELGFVFFIKSFWNFNYVSHNIASANEMSGTACWVVKTALQASTALFRATRQLFWLKCWVSFSHCFFSNFKQLSLQWILAAILA